MKLINAPSCKVTYELSHVVWGCMGRERGGEDVREGQTGHREGMCRVDNVGWCGVCGDCLDLALIEGLSRERSS